MMDGQRTVMVIGDDTEARQLRSILARHNVAVIGAGLAAGLPVELASSLCIPLDRATPRAPAPLTDEDRRRLAAASAKRQRRAAKRQLRNASKGAGGQS